MANNISEILGRDINSVKELKDAIKGLQDSLVGLDTESEEYKQTAEKLVAAQDALRQTTRAGIETNTAAKDSIVGMEQAYKNLYTQYKQLSDEQRNSDFGKNMAASLEELSNKLNETKKGVGNFKDNIGRYTDSVVGAFDKMGISIGALKGPLSTAKSGAEGLGKTFSALAKNPWMIALGALITILTKAADAIKKNEELSNRLKVAMAAFKPVLDAVANAFDFLAGLLVKTVEGLTKVATKIMSIIPGMKQAIKSHQELAQATNGLTKAQREANVENSKKTAEIERLREEASATEDVNEKKKLLLEAKELQAEVDQQNIELAQEELRILQEYSEKTANSAEENEKLAAAQEKVNQAIAQGERNQRMYNKQLAAATGNTHTATSSVKNYREEAKKLYEQLQEDNKTELQKVQEKYEREKKLLEKYHLDTTLLTKKYNEDIARINKEARQKELNELRIYLDDEISATLNELIAFDKKFQNSTTLDIEAATNPIEKARGVVELAEERLGDYEKYFKKFQELNTKQIAYHAEFRKDSEDLEAEINQLLDTVGNAYGVTLKNSYDVSNLKFILEKELKEAIQEYNDTIEGYFDSSVDAINNYMSNIGTVLRDYRFEDANMQNAIKDYINSMINDLNQRGADIKLPPDFWDNLLTPESAEAAIKELGSNLYESINDIYENIYELGYIYDETYQNLVDGEEGKMRIISKYVSFIKTSEEALAEAEIKLNQARVDSFLDVAAAIDSISNSISQNIKRQMEDGKITEQEFNKKKKSLKALQYVMTAANVAQIISTTNSALMDVTKAYASETAGNTLTAAGTGPLFVATLSALNAKSKLAMILRTAGVLANGTASMAATLSGHFAKMQSINDMSYDSGNSGSGVEGTLTTPTLIDSTPYSYYRQLQTAEEEDRLNQPIYVTVTDIQEGLSHRAQVVDESSF